MNIIVMGECMIELSATEAKTFQQNFAGDAYNTAVYLKRLVAEQANVGILTAIGCDETSHEMLSAFRLEHIDTGLVAKIKNKQVGLYMIKTRADGERSFSYWRNNSAAKQVLSHISDEQQVSLEQDTDIFYFTGISLAILNREDRVLFWKLIRALKRNGALIVFDTNFREILWQSHIDAKEQYHQAFELSDIVFLGAEDFALLYDIDNVNDITSYLSAYSIPEIIVKNGSKNVLCVFDQQKDWVEIVPVENVIDTTSAGDAFNAGYLSAKIKGESIVCSASYAATIASFVIQHRGAIVDSTIFSNFTKSL